jgi:hypothetical protein
MAVEMIIDQWNPEQRRYRWKRFVTGPLSCPIYRAGPKRKVSGRRGLVYEEQHGVDENATGHRHPDE